MSHIQLNYVFLLFWSIFGKFHWKLVKKNISERSSEIIGKFVFLNKFEKEQIQRKIRICCKQPFLFKAIKLDKYKQNLFFPQNQTHRANNACFSVVLKHFWDNSLKNSLFSPKSEYLRKHLRNTSKVCFSQQFEKGQIQRKIWISLNCPFWINQ